VNSKEAKKGLSPSHLHDLSDSPFSIFLLVKDSLASLGTGSVLAENAVQAECHLDETEEEKEHERQIPVAQQYNRQRRA